MTMRIELEFAQALDREAGTRLLLAAATLPEVRRIVLSPDRSRAALYAADIAPARLSAALDEAGTVPVRILTGLAPEAEAGLAAPPGERLRPIGR